MKKILFILIFLSACSPTDRYYDRQIELALDEKKAHTEIKIFDGDVEPDVINLDKINSTLQGEDVNRNGVRDDVEIWANRTVKQVYLRKIIKHKAKIQSELLVALLKNDKNEISRLISKESNLNMCNPPGYRLTRNEIEIVFTTFSKIWLNTQERKDAEMKLGWHWARSNNAYDSQTYKCEFDLN